MAEQYEFAAVRHHAVAEFLQEAGHIDDAAYHYGVCGENAVKHALQVTGVEAHWLGAGRPLQNTPMRGHFVDLAAKVQASQAEIALYATGRLSAAVSATLLSPTFHALFVGWSINIRYADDGITPVSAALCSQWASDAADLMLTLVVH